MSSLADLIAPQGINPEAGVMARWADRRQDAAQKARRARAEREAAYRARVEREEREAAARAKLRAADLADRIDRVVAERQGRRDRAAGTPPRFRAIVDDVASSHGLTAESILGVSRRAVIVEARHIAMARVRSELQWSLPRIGDAFGRDHTTVLFALRKHAEAAR